MPSSPSPWTTTALLAALLACPVIGQDSDSRMAPPHLRSGFDIHAGTLQSLTIQRDDQGNYLIPVKLGKHTRTMSLHPHDVRSPNFQLLVRDAAGVHTAPTPECITYRGHLVEEPGARVAASIVNGSVDAIIYRPATANAPTGDNWVVQPARKVDPAAAQSLHVVFRATDTVPLPYQCGNGPATAPPAAPPSPGTDSTRFCEIAIEADTEFYQQNGSSVTQTQNDITTVMNQVDFIYDRDVDVQFQIATILVTTVGIYTTNGPSNLLGQFRTNWLNTHTNIARDVTHLFTGRNLTGSVIGIAYLSGVCTADGYGLSQSRFSNNLNSRVGLTAHELGHNFSAPHCNSSSPCYIMCSGLGGCSNNVTLFSPTAAAQISAFAQSASCLSFQVFPPTLTAATPNNVTVFQPGGVQLTGTNLATVTSFTAGGQTFTSGYSIQSDTQMTVWPPSGTALGPISIEVDNPAGTSNPITVNYTVTTPPKLLPPAAVPPSGGIVTYQFAGQPNHLWFLILDAQNSTTPFQGFNLLSSQIVLTMGTFANPLGTHSLTFPVPGGLGYMLVYSQILEGDPSGAAATGVSNIGVTLLQ